jgi:hypothetical protein
MKTLDTAQFNGQKKALHSITYRTKMLYAAQRAGKTDIKLYEILNKKFSYSTIYRTSALYSTLNGTKTPYTAQDNGQ